METVDLGTMTTNFTIVIERHLTNPPTPLGFGVLKDRQPVAWLSLEQVERAVAQYKELESARAALSAFCCLDEEKK